MTTDGCAARANCESRVRKRWAEELGSHGRSWCPVVAASEGQGGTVDATAEVSTSSEQREEGLALADEGQRQRTERR
jgi:hypothetical protein